MVRAPVEAALGSVAVAVGDTAAASDVLDRLGNSGSPEPRTDTLQLFCTVAGFGE